MIRGKKETFYAFGYSLTSKAVTYILLLIFANLYLPEEYGLGSFAFNIRNIIMLFAFIGLPDALIPFIVRKKKISSVLNFLIIISFVFFVLGLGVATIYPWVLPLVLTFPLVMLTTVGISFWRSKSRHDFPVKVGLYSIVVVLVTAYLLRDYGKLGIVGSYALGNLFAFVAMTYPIRKDIFDSLRGNSFLVFKSKELKQYLILGVTIAFIGGIFVLMNWINSTLLGLFGNFVQVAEFGIAVAIAGVISVIPISLSMFMITRASQIKDTGKSLKVLHRVTRISFFGSLLASILLVVFISLIIDIFFPQYIGIELYVSIFSLGMVFFSSYYVVYSYHIGKMDTHKVILPIILGLTINIILALWLIPGYGVLGVALASTAAHLSILIWIGSKEKMKRITAMSLFAIAIISLVYFINYWGLLVFALVIPLSVILKIITKEDIKVIKDTISGILHVKNV
jgi:O-antigen/teichoic acid export membrane protein